MLGAKPTRHIFSSFIFCFYFPSRTASAAAVLLLQQIKRRYLRSLLLFLDDLDNTQTHTRGDKAIVERAKATGTFTVNRLAKGIVICRVVWIKREESLAHDSYINTSMVHEMFLTHLSSIHRITCSLIRVHDIKL